MSERNEVELSRVEATQSVPIKKWYMYCDHRTTPYGLYDDIDTQYHMTDELTVQTVSHDND